MPSVCEHVRYKHGHLGKRPTRTKFICKDSGDSGGSLKIHETSEKYGPLNSVMSGILGIGVCIEGLLFECYGQNLIAKTTTHHSMIQKHFIKTERIVFSFRTSITS